jgi:hypothetical protein
MRKLWDSIPPSWKSGFYAFVGAASAQIILLMSQDKDPFTSWKVWVIAGFVAIIKGTQKSVAIATSDKVLVPKSDVCSPEVKS